MEKDRAFIAFIEQLAANTWPSIVQQAYGGLEAKSGRRSYPAGQQRMDLRGSAGRKLAGRGQCFLQPPRAAGLLPNQSGLSAGVGQTAGA
nr:hypothetical protein [Aneurinibacillus sp. XH2]